MSGGVSTGTYTNGFTRRTMQLSAEQVAEGWTCKKRDGKVVGFDVKKIRKALFRCFNAVGLAATLDDGAAAEEKLVEKIAKAVVNVIEAKRQTCPEVEQVQQFIIQQLWGEGLFDAAEHYQNYREAHKKARAAKPIPADVAARVAADQKHFPTDLQYYQFMSKFSRWREADRRRETWRETTFDRVMPWLRSVPGVSLEDGEWRELGDAMYGLEASPAMRVVQMAGPALDRCNVGAYNCLGVETQFVTRDGVKSFWDFKDGDTTTVLTHTGAWKTAVVRSYGKQKLYKHVIRRGRSEVEIRATADHRWVLKDGTVSTGLNIGDRLYKAPCQAAGWNYDKAEPFEKLAWAYGYVFGDGTRVKKDGEYRYSMVRLCGADAGRFAERFEELGFASSRPLSYGGDIVVYTGSYLKTVPTLDQDISLLRAFVRGYLDADGQKQTCKTATNEFGSIQVTGEENIAFVRRVFPMVGFYITREERVADTTNLGERSDTTIRFGLLNNFGDAPNSYYSLAEKPAHGFDLETVWCLEVEDDHSFVLSEGVVTGNCAYQPLSDLFAFPELLYILMQGTGEGFSCESEYVDELPRIKKQRKGAKPDTLVVEDSTEGWCSTYYEFLQRLWDGHDAHVDVSGVRKKGTRLKTKGGRASGPEPFLELIAFARNLVKSRQGRFLEDIDAHDLACMTGKIVQVGGVRRAAEISLSDIDSVAMRNAKAGNWYDKAVHRTMANNSAVYDYDGAVPVEVFMEEWLALAKSKAGERGIFNRRAALKHSPKRRKWGRHRPGCNPCAEILLRPWQFCNLSIAIARPDDTVESLKRKVRLATVFGKIQSMCTRFGYIRKEWRENCEEERLLGVDVTGHADCPLLRVGAPGRAELQRQFNKVVEETDLSLSKRWNVNRSAANTTVKPGGDSAVFFNCASGVSPWFAAHQIRWVRESVGSPVARLLVDAGVPHAPAPEAPDSLLVFGFPRKPPAGATLRNDMPAEVQFYNWLEWKQNWAEHSVSATIYVEDHEWPKLGGLVYDHIEHITGLAFLPKDNGIYTYAPNEEVTEEKYNEFVSRFPDINWAKLSEYETEDMTEAAQTFACIGNQC